MKKMFKLAALGTISLSLSLLSVGCSKKTSDKTKDSKITTESKKTDSKTTTTSNNVGASNTYTIKFVNADDSVLSTQTLKEGETPVYNEAPTYSDEVFTYVFSGWDSEITTATSNKTYKATYDKTYIDYKVIFYDWDDQIIEESTYHKDSLMTLPSNPSRDADDIYTYKFDSWYFSEDENKVMHVKAQYVSKYIDYRVKFFDYDDELIKEATYHGDEGFLSTVPKAPTRSADKTYTYSFKAWEYSNGADEQGVFLKAKALYNETYINYTVTFMNNTQEVSSNTYHYGDTIEYPDAPTRDADLSHTYEFLYWDNSVTICTEDLVIYACFESHAINYTITFINYTGNVISTKTDYNYNNVIQKPDNPTKDYCEFLGWSLTSGGDIVTVDDRVKGNRTYYAIFDKAKYRYRFVNYDGIIVSETTDYVGSQIIPPVNNPTRDSSVSTVYVFDGWYTNMTGGVKVTNFGTLSKIEYYYARYTEETRKYTITWKLDNGNDFGTDLVEYGKTPACSNGTPTKTADAEYSYVFVGWTPAISSVTGDKTYKAVFDKVKKSYVITWKNGSTTIYTEELEYGKIPSYSGVTPTKASDAQYTYTFSGWSPLIATVTSNQTYSAEYSTTTNKYTYYFFNEEASEVVSSYTGAYGTQATKPETPTKAQDTEYTYTFNGWYELTTHVKVTDFTIKGNMYLYPKFDSAKRQYTITFRKTSGLSYTSITQAWGTTVTAPANPTRDGYTFTGWDRTIPTTMPKQNMTITATWEAAKYNVTIVNSLGSSITVSGSFTVGTTQAYQGTYYQVKVIAPKAYEITFTVDGVSNTYSNNTYGFTMPAHNVSITISGKAYSYNGYSNKILFGEYPQTLVTINSSLESSLNALISANPTSTNANGWTAYKYYNMGAQQNYMWYKDVTYNGEKYRAVYLTAYRPEMYSGLASSSESYVDENGYKTNTKYWFKYEAIAWTVSKTEDGKSLLVADLVIDGQVFNNSTSPDKYAHNGTAITAPNSYLYSDIRQFLINDFYNTAFDSLSKSIMSKRAFVGSTEDFIGLVKSSDLSTQISDTAKATDYAKIQGVQVSSGYASWYLSTTGKMSGCDLTRDVQYITTAGKLSENHNYYLRGVRPAILLNI